MDDTTFNAWLAGLDHLTSAQRSRLLDRLDAAPPISARAPAQPASDHPTPPEDLFTKLGRERNAIIGCPHCDSDQIRRWGRSAGKPRYRCTACGKTFNPLTGTPLARLRHNDRWQDQARALMEGDTLAKAATRCKVAYTTAFRWRHRFLKALDLDKPKRLSGLVEADETFIRESFKGKHKTALPRPARKRGKASKRGLSAEQIPVLVARDRSGATIDAVLPRLDAASITAVLGQVVAGSAQFCCDGGKAITAFGRRAGLVMHVLPTPGGPLPEAPERHINNVNAYHGRLKEWMRRFHGVATERLPSYLGWRRILEAMAGDATPERWIKAAAGLGPYRMQQITK